MIYTMLKGKYLIFIKQKLVLRITKRSLFYKKGLVHTWPIQQLHLTAGDRTLVTNISCYNQNKEMAFCDSYPPICNLTFQIKTTTLNVQA